MINNQRLEDIFKCIVELHVETASPVGSRAVSRRYAGQLSPASIRNVMSDLEEAGLIRQPHTSAGRVPTEKGYRFYVNSLHTRRGAEDEKKPGFVSDPSEPGNDKDRESTLSVLRRTHGLEEAAEKMSRLLAESSQNAGLFFIKGGEDDQQDRLYVDGTRRLVEQPEFHDVEKIIHLLRVFELKESLLLFLQRELERSDLHIYIGSELGLDDLSDVSMVVKEYSRKREPVGCLGVIGPTRMRYDYTVQLVHYLADTMTEYLSEW
jgi:transcriptional regulator of heat shock response